MPRPPRAITIQPVLNGWVITAGCQQVAFVDLRLMASEIIRYYTEPDVIEKVCLEGSVNRALYPVGVSTPQQEARR